MATSRRNRCGCGFLHEDTFRRALMIGFP